MSRVPSRWNRWLPLLVALLFFPCVAEAHTPIQGMGEFVNGLIHPLITPAHLLVVLGLGFFIGQRTPLNLKTPMLVFVPLSAVALVLAGVGWVTTVPQWLLLLIALITGGLVAWDKPLPSAAASGLFAAAALAIGLDSGVDSGTSGAVFKTLLGTWIALIFLVCDLGFYSSFTNRKPWLRIGLRVLASWIVAISLLVLAFALRTKG